MKKKPWKVFLTFFLMLIASPWFRAETEIQAIPEVKSEKSLRPGIIEYKADQEDFKDPFQGRREEFKKREGLVKEEPAKDLPVLTVQGLVWEGIFPQAIINNKVVKIGETIEGARIVSITKEGVTVSFQNRQYTLSSPASINLKNAQRKTGGRDEK